MNVGNGWFIVGGNWKCNGMCVLVKMLIEELNVGELRDVDVVVASSFLFLDEATETLKVLYEVVV